MDLGTIFTKGFIVEPGAGETFIVRVGNSDYGRVSDGVFGFTNIGDLMKWLGDHAAAFGNRKQAGAPPALPPSVDHMAVVSEIAKGR